VCGTLNDSSAVHAAYLQQVKHRINQQWVYPATAARERRAGQAQIDFAWDRAGKIFRVNVRSSSGHEDLDRYAVNAVRLAAIPPVPDHIDADCLMSTASFTYTLDQPADDP
jgi:TonB family protein